MKGQRHLIQCRCILPQFKSHNPPVFHQFTVFSIIGDDDKLRKHFAQCNNCGLIHKIVDVCRSEMQTSKDELKSLETIDDVLSGLSQQLRDFLVTVDVDLPTVQAITFIVNEKRWGDYVTLFSETVDDMTQVKRVRVLSETLYKVETFNREETLKK
jgi:hypothetical protein